MHATQVLMCQPKALLASKTKDRGLKIMHQWPTELEKKKKEKESDKLPSMIKAVCFFGVCASIENTELHGTTFATPSQLLELLFQDIFSSNSPPHILFLCLFYQQL